MSYILKTKNIRNFLLLFSFLVLESQENEQYIIKQLKNFSFISDVWNINQSYIYYIDIESYKIGEENIFQIFGDEIYLVNNITVSQIDESIIFDNTSEIIKKETYKKEFHIKLRKKPRKYFFELLINKTEETQKYFVILIEQKISQNSTEVEIMVSSIIQNTYIDQKDISNGKIYSTEFFMDAKIEKYKKIIFHDISLETSNLLLFIGDKGVSGFYMNNITSKETRTRLLIIPKNSTQEKDHIIYLSLIGPADKTKFQVMLDDHDILYRYGSIRLMTSFYLEKLNCTNDYYIFEDYYTDEDKSNKVSHLDINTIYGDYELIYYEIISSNISNIFIPDNSTKEILNDTFIKRVTSDSNVLKFSCKKPTLLKFKYIEENIKINLAEGQEKIIHYDKCLSYYKIYSDNIIKTKDINREYKFYFGYYKLNETEESVSTELTTSTKLYYTPHDLTKSNPFYTTKIYYNKDNYSSRFSIDVKNDNIYFKLYLISNQYYKNVVEGVTKINLDEKAIAFKIRKDIVFDYFIFKAYSYNKSNLISLEYDLKIVEKDDIDKDKVMVGMNPIKDYLKNEIIIRYSNPYDKFNSKIKEDDFVYLLIIFITNEKWFPLYVDIRYYYNNSIITIKPSEPEVILNNKEYKIFGDNNTDDFDKIMLNINKCNPNKSYSVKTFYENKDNLVLIENITDERTFLYHENLFNNTKLLFSEEKNKSNNSISNYENVFQQNSYYQNGDLYMNYFPYNEELFNNLKITNDYSIKYEDSDNETIFKWNNYLLMNDYLLNESEKYPVNYSIYIFPKTSPIDSICQMSLIPPNISVINQNSQEFYLEKGEYKISIIASIVNKKFPLVTYYNFLEFEVPYKYNIKLIIILSVSGLILIALIIFIIIYCKKRKKKDEFEDIDINRESRIQSMVKSWGLGGEKENLFFNNDDEEDEVENIINNDDQNIEKDEKEVIVKEIKEENNFGKTPDN